MPRFSFSLILSAMSLATGIAHAEPQRIVSVGGSVTEVLYAVGVQERIVGVDSTSLYPADALTTKPDVGYLRALSPEGILALSPDLIVLEKDAGPREAVELIDQAGVSVVHVPAGYELVELPQKIRAIADAVGKKTEGDHLASDVEADLAGLKRDLAGVEKKKRVLFILSLTDGRPMAAGANTAADGIIRLAGAENVFSEITGYKTISPEAAAALQPDAILMITRSGAAHEGTDILKQPAFAETPAGRTGAFIKMDGLYLLGFGPRTPQAARDLAARLYPDLKLASSQ